MLNGLLGQSDDEHVEGSLSLVITKSRLSNNENEKSMRSKAKTGE